MKRKGESVLRSQILLLLIHSTRVSSQNGIFFQPDTFLGFGCDATTVSDAGIWHDSSSESSEVRVGRVKLGSLSNSVLERRTSTGSGLFASLGSGLVETLG